MKQVQDSGGVPEQAVDKLCATLDKAGIQLTGWHTGRVALEDAAPAIRAQERERIREMLRERVEIFTNIGFTRDAEVIREVIEDLKESSP